MNTVILGVSNDPPAANKHFRDKFSFPFDLLCDEDNKMGLAYGAVESKDAEKQARISYVISPEGKVKIAYATVVAAEHPEQVLKDLGG